VADGRSSRSARVAAVKARGISGQRAVVPSCRRAVAGRFFDSDSLIHAGHNPMTASNNDSKLRCECCGADDSRVYPLLSMRLCPLCAADRVSSGQYRPDAAPGASAAVDVVTDATDATDAAAEPADATAAGHATQIEVTERLQQVLATRLHADGTLRTRSHRPGERRIERSVLADLYAILRRPIDVDDISAEYASLLVNRWRKAGSRPRTIRPRIDWLKATNAVAVAMSLCPPQDFSEVKVLREHDWTKDRRAIPLPEPTQERGKRSTAKAKMPLPVLLKDHYVPQRLLGKSENTVRLYNHSINAFSKYIGRTAVIADLNTKTVSDFLGYSLRETELSKATIQKDRTQLVALWNYSARKGWSPEFPEIASIVVPDRVPDSWNDEQLVALMNACKSCEGMIGKIPACDYWPALVSVIFDTAERIGAVLQTEWRSLDKYGNLVIRGEHRKGGKRDKPFRLRPLTLERLNAIRIPGERFILPWPYRYEYIFQKFGEVVEAAGLPRTRRDLFHKIRRTVASKFEAAGGNATDLLDHSSRKTTKKNYLDPAVLKTTQPADVVPGIGEDVNPLAKPDSDTNAELLEQLRKLLGGNPPKNE